MGDNKLEVAIVKYVCPICGKVNEDASAIVMNRLLTKSMAQKVEAMHNQVIGFSDKPCKECQKVIDQGAFFVIGVDMDKTDDIHNPYRSGHIVGIKKSSEFYKRLPNNCAGKDAIFMSYKEMRDLGIIK